MGKGRREGVSLPSECHEGAQHSRDHPRTPDCVPSLQEDSRAEKAWLHWDSGNLQRQDVDPSLRAIGVIL